SRDRASTLSQRQTPGHADSRSSSRPCAGGTTAGLTGGASGAEIGPGSPSLWFARKNSSWLPNACSGSAAPFANGTAAPETMNVYRLDDFGSGKERYSLK